MGVFVWHSTEKTKTSKKYGSSFKSRRRSGLPPMVELVQKELEHHKGTLSTGVTGSHVNHGYVEG